MTQTPRSAPGDPPAQAYDVCLISSQGRQHARFRRAPATGDLLIIRSPRRAAHADQVEMARLLPARGADPALIADDGRHAAALAGLRVTALLEGPAAR